MPSNGHRSCRTYSAEGWRYEQDPTMEFVKQNFTFILASFATIVSILWFIAQPDFEPAITATLGLLTSIGFRPKDWKIVIKKDVSVLPNWDSERISVESGKKRTNTITEKAGYKRFNYEFSFEGRDKSIEFTVPSPKYRFGDMEIVPVRLIMVTQVNSDGPTQHYVYSVIPDKMITCIFQFEGSCGEFCVEDIDGDGVPELLIGYKRGAHTECIKLFKLDRNFDFAAIEGSDVCGDFSLVTWEFVYTKFIIKTYSKNYEIDRESWHALVDSYEYKNSVFEHIKSEKIKYINSITNL